MSISLRNLALNAGGIALDAISLGRFSRNISIYDQEDFEAKAGLTFNPFNKPKQIMYGVPLYHSGAMSAQVNTESRICENPVEAGFLVADHKVVMPKTIKIRMSMPYYLGNVVIEEIEKYFYTSKKVVLQMPTGVYFNMVLTSLPVNLTPNDVDAPIYDLSFKEIIVVQPQLAGIDENNAANPQSSDTVSTLGGLVSMAVPSGVTNFLKGVF